MALFLIERSFAEQLDLTGEDVRVIEDINADEGVNWLFSFLSADRRRSVLPVRGAVAGSDHRRGQARQRAGRPGGRGQQVPARAGALAPIAAA